MNKRFGYQWVIVACCFLMIFTVLGFASTPRKLYMAVVPEVLGIADRIIVMCDGRVTGELDIQDATQEKILELATRFENKLDA